MDTDIRDVDVDKDLHLSLLSPHSSNESPQGPSLRCESNTLPLERDPYAPLDFAMSAGESSLGFHSQGKMFYESSVVRDYPGSGQ